MTILLDSNCQVALPDYTADVVASDNCDGDLTFNQAPAPGTILSGNANINVANDMGNCDAAIFVPVPTSGNNCGVASVTND